ncbi:sulfotransferase [Mycobacterium kubicae]|uniref:Sulfotransferase n=1 Tax=Mycobacterium kubicae TaxID=120959 RepID=A0AAX1J9C2_9MYCO|nr:sulfotransferase [Mycobacterium kubicae]MCV7094284.1 sulfotransferase [Mycobacterium kubicae]ORV98939.1 hypothetical protein AWC13_12105 [Mycobacterium kubicae]QPI38109.1 sulfotransferase [Mycobacterium kubicae]GFG65543.1 sulfotransferase [Mycobacterium kubicae]
MTSVDELHEKACARAHLEDFGSDSYVEGLTVLVASLSTEARLNDVGRHVLFGKLVKLLVHRLQIEDWYRRHPQIEDEKLLAPLIGVGLPRTGSSALSHLLNEDPQVRSLAAWMTMEPCPPPSTVPSPDPRIAAAQKSIEQQHRAAPGLAAMVPASALGPAECVEMLALDFKSHVFGCFAHVPSYQDWLMHHADLRSAYRYERRVLKLLQWGLPQRPWRLKAPAHLPHIEALTHVFDDARLVCTHRDPVAVMPSCFGLYEATTAMFTDHVDRSLIGKQNIDTWSLGMQRMMRFRDHGGEQRCFDIDHREMQRDPIGVVERLYDWLGQPVTPQFRAGMQQWWRDNAADRQTVTYKPLEAYGQDKARVEAAFAPYIERFITPCGVNSAHGQT